MADKIAGASRCYQAPFLRKDAMVYFSSTPSDPSSSSLLSSTSSSSTLPWPSSGVDPQIQSQVLSKCTELHSSITTPLNEKVQRFNFFLSRDSIQDLTVSFRDVWVLVCLFVEYCKRAQHGRKQTARVVPSSMFNSHYHRIEEGPQWQGNHGQGSGGNHGQGSGGPHKRHKSNQSTSIEVLTNFFKVGLQVSSSNDGRIRGYYAYAIEVLDAVRPKHHENGNESFDVVEKVKTNPKTAARENPEVARSIVEQLKSNLWKQSEVVLASEGHQFGVSPCDLCHPEVLGDSQLSRGGPGSERSEGEQPALQRPAPGGALTRDFVVRLISDVGFIRTQHQQPDRCRELVDHRHQNSWYIVRLTQLDFVPFGEVEKVLQTQEQVEQGVLVAKCVDAVVRSMLLSTLLAPGKSPRMFYLPPAEHDKADAFQLLNSLSAYHVSGTAIFAEITWGSLTFLLVEKHAQKQEYRNSYFPLVGIRHNTCYVKGRLLLGVDTSMAYFNRDKRGEHDVPVLELANGYWNIAGVEIRQIPIVDNALQTKVKDALKKIKFNIRYSLRKDKDGKPLTLPNVREFRRMVMKAPKKEKGSAERMDECIFWEADNDQLYKFEWSKNADDEKHATSVYHYFLNRYGIKLNHPKLPLVGTYKGYFPIEFLYMALAKTKNANSDLQKKDALAFNDKFSGYKRIEHINFVRDRVQNLNGSGSPPDKMLKAFKLSLSNEPLAIMAKVLTPPTLVFADKTMDPRNGSWNLQNVKFHSPSTLNSFAVLDMTEGGKGAGDVLPTLFRKMTEHGITLPINVDLNMAMKKLIVRCSMPYGRDLKTLHDGVRQAIDQAKNYFLDVVASHIGFHTLAPLLYENTVGSTETCCAINAYGKIGLVFDPRNEKGESDFMDSRWPTHNVVFHGGKESRVRCYYLVELLDQGGQLNLDPFEITWTPSGYFGRLNGANHRVSKPMGIGYKDSDGNPIANVDVESCDWIHLVDRSLIECPAIIFVCLPKKEATPYKAVKYLTNAVFGVQSQCLVQNVYSNRKGEYLSNVTLKLNTKLANSWSNGRAWISDTIPSIKHEPWLNEAPTLIIGLGISHSTTGWSAVVASVCLDDFNLSGQQGGFMQMGHETKVIIKSDVIPKGVMKELVMSLAFQYSRRVLPGPALRVLFYRDGGSDGNFPRLLTEEFEGIKAAFQEVNVKLNCMDCPGCAAKTCSKHLPLVTYMVAQSDHGIRIVPKPRQGDRTSTTQNVPFGTCVDHTVVSSSDGGPNFLLIAQHGLKGTSRALYYKVLVNENFAVPDHLREACTALSSELLQKITFCMSFHYGTATKSVRHVPVVLYSKRLAEQVLGYLSYIQSERLFTVTGLDEVKSFDRTDRNLVLNIPMLRNGILPAFGPFEPRLAQSHIAAGGLTEEQDATYVCLSLRNPYRPHLAA